eukprot:maker-scaffold170_size291898-snap-gene-1.41 protein:Tk03021 transcript:maker-scaffold170_size291898-snap-gene-1.41-mRNA-1 annotation:"transient receptor potential cation channel protein painless"
MENKSSIGGIMRTGSCMGEPQANALQCLKSRELTVFVDLINGTDVETAHGAPLPPDHWINSPLPEEADQTLLMIALEQVLHDFVEVLLKAGADASLMNSELGRAPIHVAVLHGNLDGLRMLLKDPRNQANVNATASAKGGQTALHMAVDANHQEMVELLIKQPNVDVNVKDKKGGKTPLYLAVKAGSRALAEILVGAGADFKLSCFGKQIYPDLMREKLPGFDPTGIPRKIAPLAHQMSQGTFERMADIIDNAHVQDYMPQSDIDEFKSLLLQTDAHTLNNKHSNGYTLLQKASHNGLSDLVVALLEDEGCNPNGVTENAPIPPQLMAATQGHASVLQVFVDHKADFGVRAEESSETVLHCILKAGDRDDPKFMACLKVIFDSEPVMEDIQHIINKRDELGNTALHYATQKWPQSISRALLENGANIGMKNHWNETPIEKIQPDTLEAFLNEYCIEAKGDVNHENFELTFNYSFLAPPKEDLPFANQDGQDDPESQKLSSGSDFKVALPETQSLWYMGQSKEHRHLLKHPVVTSFLYLKWQRIRRFFNRNVRFYLLFVFVLTWYIFDQFGGESIRYKDSNQIPFWYGLFVLFSLMVLLLIIRDWAMDLKDIMRSERVKRKNPSEEDPLSSGKLCFMIVFSNWIEVLLIGFLGVILFTGQTYLWLALLILTVILTLREFFQATVSLKSYLLSPENWLEMSIIVLIALILGLERSEFNTDLKRHLSAIVIVLSWAELITLVGKHPKLTTYNVYVTMFYKVMGTFFFFLCWYMFFIIAFGLGFYIMLHKDGANYTSGPDDYVFFNQPWLALVKTSTMFVGELEFSDIPVDLESSLAPLSYLFFLSFVFLIVVVLMNLLNGLAVSDTGVIQEKAEIVSYISQVATISYTESVLLGDPFNFLSNWPRLKLLLNIPSCSLCKQLYRNKWIQRMFHKMTGATGILLFYKFLPTKRLTLTPNGRKSDCNCLEVELMDESIIASAKNIVLKKNVPRNLEQRVTPPKSLEELLSDFTKLKITSEVQVDLIIQRHPWARRFQAYLTESGLSDEMSVLKFLIMTQPFVPNHQNNNGLHQTRKKHDTRDKKVSRSKRELFQSVLELFFSEEAREPLYLANTAIFERLSEMAERIKSTQGVSNQDIDLLLKAREDFNVKQNGLEPKFKKMLKSTHPSTMACLLSIL